MSAARLLLTLLVTLAFCGCSAEYYARRQERREQRLALRQERIAARQAQEQQRNYVRCSNPQLALERGHNDGLSRRPMDSSWVAQCPPQFQQQQYAAYSSGYQQGIDRAGTQVVVAPGFGGPGGIVVGTHAGVEGCTFSSDCGSQMSCRQWGDMGNVCMGFGSSGAPCWFGSDCLSGWCDGGGRSRTCR